MVTVYVFSPKPWKSNNIPKAFVSLSNPSKSTRMTDVNPT